MISRQDVFTQIMVLLLCYIDYSLYLKYRCLMSKFLYFIVFSLFILPTGNVTSYLSSIIHPDRKIFAFGATPQTREKFVDKMETMGAHSILSRVYTFLCLH